VEENPIVGHGDFKYRVDKEWGIQEPYSIPVNDCHEMILDKKNRIFMTTTHPKKQYFGLRSFRENFRCLGY
jgi:hypothetical protein